VALVEGRRQIAVVMEEIPLTLVLDEGMVAGPATALGFVEDDAGPTCSR
jgi:hypothetical protein